MGKKKRSSSGNSQEVKTEQEKSWLIMNQVKPPEPFNFEESASWSTWIKHYKMFHSAVGLSSAGEDQQISMLLYCMGQEAEELLSSVGMTEEKRTSFSSVVTTFEDYFLMKKNKFYYRALFLERNQRPGEKVDSYVDDLRKLSEKCGWSCKNCKSKDFEDEMILIKVITGVNDKNVSKRLQRQDITKLTECVKVLRESEMGEEKDNDADVSKEFTMMRIGRENTRPGPQVVPHSLNREAKSSVSECNSNVKPASFSPAPQHQECASPMSSRPKFTLREEKGNMRSSFSSGVDTGDEYAMDELSYINNFCVTGESDDRFYNVAANFERNSSSGSFCEDRRLKSRGCTVVNCPHVARKRQSASTAYRKLVTGGKPASVQWQPRNVTSPYNDFDSDEDDEYLENLYDFHRKNYSSYTSNKTCSSGKSTFELDDSWPELEKTSPNVDDKPKSFENNYHFSVSGYTSRKSLKPVGLSPKVKYKTEYAYVLFGAETNPTNQKSLKSVQPFLSYTWCN